MKNSPRRIADCTVLCVVNNFDLIQELEAVFKFRYHYATGSSEFYRLLTATKGQDALGFDFRDVPILAILDENLPDISGYELARRLESKIGKRHAISYVFLVQEENPVKKMPGAFGWSVHYVAKPVTAEIIDQNIQTIVRQRRIHSPQGKNLHTHLPNATRIRNEINDLVNQQDWALLYIYIDWVGIGVFREVMCIVANFIEETIDQYGTCNDLIVHVGTDGFLVVTRPDEGNLPVIIQSLQTFSFKNISMFQSPEFTHDLPTQLSVAVLQATDGPFSNAQEIEDWVANTR